MRESLGDGEREMKPSAFVHTFVGLDRKCEVEGIIGIREIGLHGTGKGKLGKI